MAVLGLVQQLVLALEPRWVELEFLNIKIILMLYFLKGKQSINNDNDRINLILTNT